jgi:threonine 3-dehydrogenase
VKALVKETAAPGFVLKDVPKPTIRDDEVLIRVKRAGVCGTDVHIYDWDAWAQNRVKPPTVIGHEFAGEVVEAGRLVTDVHPGDRVTAEGHIVDGRCLLCRTGNSHVCPHTKIIGVDRDGCFAEYIAMPATNVWHLDDNISFDIGGIHDPMGNAFHTALTADIPGSTVLVTGCGPIGIFAVGICKAAGASRIIASDINDTRLALAKQMGAHDIVHPSEAEAVVKRHTDGLGVDVVLEMSGRGSASGIRAGARRRPRADARHSRQADRHRFRDGDHLQGPHRLRSRWPADVRHLAADDALSALGPVRSDTGDHASLSARAVRRRDPRHQIGRGRQGHLRDRLTAPS